MSQGSKQGLSVVEVSAKWDTLNPLIQGNILGQPLFEGISGQLILDSIEEQRLSLARVSG